MKIKGFPLTNPNDLEEAIRGLLEAATDSPNGITAHDACAAAKRAAEKHRKARST